jgi:integrase
MKAGREHRVPLSNQAVALLKRMLESHDSEYAFPGGRRPTLSNMAMDMLLRRMNSDVTVHGFRSCFRTWAAERTTFAREVIEAALAHVVGDETERAYQRGDLFDKRRRLMSAWADYCAQQAAVVIQIRSRNAANST